jgi:hypothetical protein
MMLIQQLIVEIQIPSFMGSNNFRGQTPHQGSISRSENNNSFQNRQFKQSFQGVSKSSNKS